MRQKTKNDKKLPLGMDLYSIATGNMNPFKKSSQEAARFIASQDGFFAAHPCDRGILWMFDSLNHAKLAKNAGKVNGVQFGVNIGHFVVVDCDTIKFVNRT